MGQGWNADQKSNQTFGIKFKLLWEEETVKLSTLLPAVTQLSVFTMKLAYFARN